MAEKDKKPEIRFAGFTDTWEQRKLEEVFDMTISNNTLPRAALSNDNGTIKNIHYGDVLVKYGASTDITNDDVPYIIGAEFSDYKNQMLQDGDIIIADTAEDETVGKATEIVNLQGNFVISGLHTIVCRPRIEMQPYYLGYYMNSDAYHEQLLTLMQGIKVLSISRSNLSKTNVCFPMTATEQAQIGRFFRELDNLISLHQRKYDKLVIVKKSMLEKMFPKDGASVPEIRFAGFTDAWEQRKLGELYTERKERGYESLQILSVSIHHGVSNEELDSDTLGKKVRRSEDKSLYKHVYFGDLVLNMMRAWQGAIGVVKSEGMVSPAYITAIPSAQIYPLFMDYCLRRDEMISQMDNLSYGVTDFRKRLYWDSFINVLCRIPSVPEQERITVFFTHLDHLITLHRSKLEKLKNVKKSLIQKMFV